jgi:hypothetical protein
VHPRGTLRSPHPSGRGPGRPVQVSEMQTIAFAAPMLPGKTQEDRDALASVASGERRADHAASRARAGIRREAVWLQSTPSGDVAVVLIEADDIEAAMGALATSHDPFDQWFRDHIQNVHGMDLTAPSAPPEQLLDFRA